MAPQLRLGIGEIKGGTGTTGFTSTVVLFPAAAAVATVDELAVDVFESIAFMSPGLIVLAMGEHIPMFHI
jgi:hypothetical protein